MFGSEIGFKGTGKIIPQGAPDDLHNLAVVQIDTGSEFHVVITGLVITG
jgi:hypothetical protein